MLNKPIQFNRNEILHAEFFYAQHNISNLLILATYVTENWVFFNLIKTIHTCNIYNITASYHKHKQFESQMYLRNSNLSLGLALGCLMTPGLSKNIRCHV